MVSEVTVATDESTAHRFGLDDARLGHCPPSGLEADAVRRRRPGRARLPQVAGAPPLYHFRATHGPVDLAFTDRHGGVSGVPFDSLNLAIEGDDDEGARAENLRLVLDDFAPGAAFADLHQVHGADVEVVEGDATSPDDLGRALDGAELAVMAREVLGVVGSLYSFGAPYKLDDATPLAQLIEDQPLCEIEPTSASGMG